jgi:PAS domain S-box-containing protein
MDTGIAALTGAATRILSARTIDEALQRTVEALRALTGAQRAAARLDSDPAFGPALEAVSPAAPARASARSDEAGGKAIAVPLIGPNGARLGTITLSGTAAGNFSEADRAVLAELAPHAALAIENARLRAAAEVGEARIRDFADFTADALWESDENHRFTYLSASAHSSLSARRSAMIGKTRWEVSGGDANDPLWRGHIADLDAHRPIDGFEFVSHGLPGKRRVLRISGRPRFAADRRFLGYRGVADDVTALRAAEAARQASERRFQEFAEIGSEVLWETDAEHRYTLFLARGSFRMRRSPKSFIGKTRWEAIAADPADPLWARHIAERPDQTSLLAALDRLLAERCRA